MRIADANEDGCVRQSAAAEGLGEWWQAIRPNAQALSHKLDELLAVLNHECYDF